MKRFQWQIAQLGTMTIPSLVGIALITPIALNVLSMTTVQALPSPFLQSQARSTAKVSGTVTYLQRIALPPNAIVEVKLQEVSRLDAPAVTLAEQTIPTEGRQVPFAFELSYDTSQINPSYTYVVQARILVDGELRWINNTAYRVITQGNPTTVEIIVQPARPSLSTEPSSTESTENTATDSTSRYDCNAQDNSFQSASNISLEEARRLRLQREGNEFVYQCAPSTARPNRFRYNCRSQVEPYTDRESVGLAEAERLMLQMKNNLFVYECKPI